MHTHADKLLLQTHDGVVLCRGINAADEHFWLYIRADHKGLSRIQRDYEEKKVANFIEYGKVIRKGFGSHVPYDVKRFMEEKYGFQH